MQPPRGVADLRKQTDMGKRTCSVLTCDGPVNARGWCSGHYARWRTTGDVQADIPLESRRPKAGRICTIPDCGKAEDCRGWCQAHYKQWQATGDPLGHKPRKPGKGIYLPGDKVPREWITCKDCGNRALVRLGGQGYCSKECASKHRTGEAHPAWKGDEAGYHPKHARVYRVRGKADHCSVCGRDDDAITYHWANLTGNYDDIWDFAPMCPACHGAYDAPLKPRGSAVPIAKLTEERVAEARRRRASGESIRSMAAEYGVSDVALGNAIAGRTWKHVPLEA